MSTHLTPLRPRTRPSPTLGSTGRPGSPFGQVDVLPSPRNSASPRKPFEALRDSASSLYDHFFDVPPWGVLGGLGSTRGVVPLGVLGGSLGPTRGLGLTRGDWGPLEG